MQKLLYAMRMQAPPVKAPYRGRTRPSAKPAVLTIEARNLKTF